MRMVGMNEQSVHKDTPFSISTSVTKSGFSLLKKEVFIIHPPPIQEHVNN